MSEAKKERLAKVMARAGLCSRRDAEQWIKDGRVKLNGAIRRDPAMNVGDADEIIIDGRPLPKLESTRLWILHKPAGFVTTARDPEGRETVFSLLPKSMPRVVSVGRLDLNSEGLLLLTNDGELSRQLELPSTGLPRRYRVRIYGRIERDELQQLRDGIVVDGIRYGSINVEFEQQQQNLNQWVIMTLHEGKNREIRRVMNALGVEVNRLIRIAYGPFELGALEPGRMSEVSTNIVENFKRQLQDKQ
ncbi:MAG TPA: pseudouridine synthase [Alphaproteobacteria bacterium]